VQDTADEPVGPQRRLQADAEHRPWPMGTDRRQEPSTLEAGSTVGFSTPTADRPANGFS